jgi:hypothetical protein
MEGAAALVAYFGAACASLVSTAAEQELSCAIHEHEVRAHVYTLASPEYMGRSGPGAARASRYVADAFQRLHLEPAFNGSFYQPISSLLDEGTSSATILGRNVGAVLPGADPRLRDEWSLVSAHYDHLGKIGDTLFPGADDNATGVAMLLEVAEAFALSKSRPRRTLVFVSFDLEEQALRGSTYFALRSPRPFRNLKAFLTADMLGRSMANVMDEYLFVLGSENSTRLRQLVTEVKPLRGLTVGRLGADLIGTRSDYGPFRDRDIPFLFFSTGQHPDYHQPTDLPERVDYVKVCRASCWIRDLTERLVNDDAAPSWNSRPLPPDLDEIRTVFTLVHRVLTHPRLYPLTEKKREVVEGVERRLRQILQRKQVTAADRTWLLWSGRMMLLNVF